MNIYSNQPPYESFIRNERNTLSVLSSNTFILANFRQLSQDAIIWLSALKGVKPRDLAKTPFRFNSHFNLIIERVERKICIEGLATPEYDHVSYILSMFEQPEPPLTLIRKFHFDFAIPNPNDTTPKPVFHIQYGGEQSPGLKDLEVDVHFQSWLSSPRIYSRPVNLALLLDMIFNEFQSQITHSLVQRPEWSDLIKTNETFLLKPYYTSINNFITTKHSSRSLLRNYCYGQC